MSTEERITIRCARPSDAAGVSECWYRAFTPSVLNDWILPPVSEHPSYLSHFSRLTRSSLINRDGLMFVATAESGMVVGYITYREMRDGLAVKDPNTPMQRVSGLFDAVYGRLVEGLRWLVLGESFSYVDHRFKLLGDAQARVFASSEDWPGVSHYLYIIWLAVHPKYQGRGIFHQLLQYGVDRGLPMYLEASPMGYPVYLHKGFKELSQRLEIRKENGDLVESLSTLLYPGRKS